MSFLHSSSRHNDSIKWAENGRGRGSEAWGQCRPGSGEGGAKPSGGGVLGEIEGQPGGLGGWSTVGKGDSGSDERGKAGGREKAVRAGTWALGEEGTPRTVRSFEQTCGRF